MGKGIGGILGAIVGVAIAIVIPGVGWAAAGYIISTSAGIGLGIEAGIMAAKMNREMQAMKDAAGMPITTSQEGLPVAMVFGKTCIGGNIIRTGDPKYVKVTNGYFGVIFGHCRGPINSFVETWINDIKWADLKPTNKWKYQYTGTTTQNADTNVFASGNMSYRGLAYTITKFGENDQVGITQTIRALIEGMKCTPIGGGAAVFTRNPVAILYHVLTQIEGWAAGDIDEDSFNAAAAHCDEVPTGGSLPRYRFDFAFDRAYNLNDAKKFIWGSFNGCSFISQGKVKVAYEAARASSFTFDESNIVEDSLSYSVPTNYNIVRLTYLDSTDQKYVNTTIEEKDDDDIIKNGEIPFDITCEYITDPEIARRRCKMLFNQIRYTGIVLKLGAFPSAITVEPFDVVKVTYSLFGWTEKLFMVKKREESPEGYCNFEMDEYNAGLYSDEESVEQVSTAIAKASSFRAIDHASAVVATETSSVNRDGLYIPSINVTYETSDDILYDHSDIYIKNQRDASFRFIGSDYSSGAGFAIDSGKGQFGVGDTVTVSVVAVSKYGVSAGTADEGPTAIKKISQLLVAPSVPSGLKLAGAASANTYNWSGTTFEVEWRSASQTGGLGREGFGQEVSGMGGTGVDPYWLYDELEVWVSGVKRYSTKTKNCHWRYVLGDTEDVELDAYVLATNGALTIKVRRWNTFNKVSDYTSISILHSAPLASILNPIVDFTGKDCRITWTAYSKTDFKGYWVKVYSDSGRSTLVRSTLVTNPTYTYSWEMNKADNGGSGLRDLYFTIMVATNYGQSASENCSGSNSTPATPSAPTVTQAFQRLKIDWSAVADTDIIGYNVYVGTGASPTTLAGTVNGTTFMYEGVAGTTYYVRLKAVDSFGAGNYSADGSGAAQHLDPAEAGNVDCDVPLPHGIVWSTSSKAVWTSGTISYQGESHSITGGNTTNKFIYWDHASPTVFQSSASRPAYGADIWIVAIYIAAGDTVYPMVAMKTMHGSILADDSISTDQIADNSITNALMADDSVDSAEIADGAVDHVHLADDSVEGHNIADNTIPDSAIISISSSKITYAEGDPTTPPGIAENTALNYNEKKNLTGQSFGCIINMGNNKLLASGSNVAPGYAGMAYYSDDNGETWTAVDTPPSSSVDMVYCGNGIVVGVDTGGNIWKSTDYGDIWADTTKNAGGAGTNFSCIEYLGNGVLLIGVEGAGVGDRGIWKSTDYGDNWSQIGSFDFNIHSLLYLGSGVALAGARTTGHIYYSNDSGDSWTLKLDPSGSGADTTLSFCKVRESEILACNGDYIYRSTDNGLNWVDDTNYNYYFYFIINMGEGKILGGTCVGNPYLYKSSDYGNAFSSISGFSGHCADGVYIGNGVAVVVSGESIYKTDKW
jgi:hypothetical protein